MVQNIHQTNVFQFQTLQTKTTLLCVFKKGHLANTCSEKYSCRKCHRRHNIAICTFSKPGANPVNNNSQLSSQNNLSDNKNNVLLQTATVQISANFQIPKTETVNIIFDSGSQRSYITNDLDSKFCNADILPVQFVIGQKVVVIECLCSPFICSDLTNQSNDFVSKD